MTGNKRKHACEKAQFDKLISLRAFNRVEMQQHDQKQAGRGDGRETNEIRVLACDQGFLHQADGSARFSHGHTSVVVGVYGPCPPTYSRQEIWNRAILQVSVKPEIGLPGTSEKEYEQIMKQTFEPMVDLAKYPRTKIDIIVQVIENDGSLVSVATNAINLALIDAGIAMKGFVHSMTCSSLTSGKICLDPGLKEENEAVNATTIFAFNSAEEGILTSISTGTMDEEQYFACAEAARR